MAGLLRPLALSDLQIGLLVGCTTTLVAAGLAELIRVVRARRLRPSLALVHDPQAVSNLRSGGEQRHEAQLLFRIENSGHGLATDWRLTITSDGGAGSRGGVFMLPIGSSSSSTSKKSQRRTSSGGWEVEFSSREGEVIQPKAVHPIASMVTAVVPMDGEVTASYLLLTGSQRWQGAIVVEHVEGHRCSVIIAAA